MDGHRMFSIITQPVILRDTIQGVLNALCNIEIPLHVSSPIIHIPLFVQGHTVIWQRLHPEQGSIWNAKDSLVLSGLCL